jgi:predicted exporter
MLPIGAGIAAAVAVSQLVFGSLHGLTLAFGMTLIGVAIDYIAHFLSHQHLAPDPDGPKRTLKRIWPGLAVGAATTVAGLIGLAWTSFPGVRQIAVFTTVGVVTSLLVTRYVLPPFSLPSPPSGRLLTALARGSERTLGFLAAHRRSIWILPAAAAVVCAVGWPRVQWQDDLRQLSSPDPQLLAEEERVRARVSRMDTGRLVVATGEDMQQALERNAQVHRVLTHAAEDGLIERHRSLHPLLWPASLQRKNHDAIPDDAWERTASALKAQSFVVDKFEPFKKALDEPFEPLRFEQMEGTPIAPLTSTFRVEMEDGMALLSFIRGLEDAQALAERVESIDGVRWLDQGAVMEQAYRNFRTRTLELVGFGLIAVFGLLLARYRRFGPALAAFLPALLAAFTAIGVLGLFGLQANLLHVVTLLLVLSMGVDYGVFMVESGRHPEGRAATLVALVTACGSTMLSFGVLGLSQNPAMSAMGLTAAIGVALALVLAPMAWVLLGPSAEHG